MVGFDVSCQSRARLAYGARYRCHQAKQFYKSAGDGYVPVAGVRDPKVRENGESSFTPGVASTCFPVLDFSLLSRPELLGRAATIGPPIRAVIEPTNGSVLGTDEKYGHGGGTDEGDRFAGRSLICLLGARGSRRKMNKVQSLLVVAVAIAALALPRLANSGLAQSPAAAPAPTVLTLGSFGHAVQDLDAEVRFYKDGLGLDLVSPASAAMVDEARNRVMGTLGARTRFARFAIPNEPYFVELVEYTGIDRKPTNPRHSDPGTSFLNVGYVDMAAVYAALRPFQPKMVGSAEFPTAEQIAAGSAPVAWIRDPDGFMLELMHGGWDPMLKGYPYVRNAYRSHFGMTEKIADSMAFYHDLLGFDVSPGSVNGRGVPGPRPVGEGLGKMVGVQVGGTYAPVMGHCANAHCETWDYEDVPGGVTPFHPRPQDPGAAYLSMWVNDLDGLLARIKASNLEVVTPGGLPVSVDSSSRFDVVPVLAAGPTAGPTRVKTSRQVLVRDASGFLVLLMQRESQ
jgi:catechol 2,3-dioxygenase-like lactoylglutathione lyase family enzyme